MQNIKKTHNNYKHNLPQKSHLTKLGKFSIKSLCFFRVDKKKIELIHFMLLRKSKLLNLKNRIKVWNSLLMNKNLTYLPQESRMGKGKGSILTQAYFIKPGAKIFEFDNLTYEEMSSLFKCFRKKLFGKVFLTSN